MAREAGERKRLEALGHAVREARTAMGHTQESFGYAIQIDRTYVSGVERGVRNPTVAVLFRIADGLEMPLSELLRRAEELSADQGPRREAKGDGE